eukprot:6541456-Alexandrium_andersonii.AAC.1
MEYALGDALRAYRIAQLRRIPGASNTIAGALSRQSAPEPKPFPSELAPVHRSMVPAGGPGYYP